MQERSGHPTKAQLKSEVGGLFTDPHGTWCAGCGAYVGAGVLQFHHMLPKGAWAELRGQRAVLDWVVPVHAAPCHGLLGKSSDAIPAILDQVAKGGPGVVNAFATRAFEAGFYPLALAVQMEVLHSQEGDDPAAKAQTAQMVYRAASGVRVGANHLRRSRVLPTDRQARRLTLGARVDLGNMELMCGATERGRSLVEESMGASKASNELVFASIRRRQAIVTGDPRLAEEAVQASAGARYSDATAHAIAALNHLRSGAAHKAEAHFEQMRECSSRPWSYRAELLLARVRFDVRWRRVSEQTYRDISAAAFIVGFLGCTSMSESLGRVRRIEDMRNTASPYSVYQAVVLDELGLGPAGAAEQRRLAIFDCGDHALRTELGVMGQRSLKDELLWSMMQIY